MKAMIITPNGDVFSIDADTIIPPDVVSPLTQVYKERKVVATVPQTFMVFLSEGATKEEAK